MRTRTVEVGRHRLEAVLEFAPGEALRTSDVPGFSSRALTVLPGLRGHRCDNGAGRTFADELHDTEIAHVVEHASLEIMALAGAPDTLRGRTSWDVHRDGHGVFRLTIECPDPAVGRGALALALDAVEWAVSADGDAPDVAAAARRLLRAV